MPAVSEKQQMAAGIAHSYKKGEIPKSELRGASKQMAEMSGEDLKDFAKTKRKKLPMKKAAVQGYLEGYMSKKAFGQNISPADVPNPIPAPLAGQGGLKEWLTRLNQTVSPNITAPAAGAAGGAALGGLLGGKKTALGGAAAGGLAGAAMSPAGMEILGRIRSALSSKTQVPA